MKLGLITDIHEQTHHLRTALSLFRKEDVEQVVVIGDVCEMGERIEETCRLLAEAKAIGVWGNHDFGLCVDLDDDMRQKYPSVVIEYMASLKPRLLVGGCHFTHVEPWLNPEELADLWYFEGPPDDQSKLERIFNAVPNRIMFAGHYHKWLLVTPDGMRDWKGDSPIRLHHGRYFVVVGALCEGQFAIFDTDSSELLPFSVD
jgi:predicted phosphodiesterase